MLTPEWELYIGIDSEDSTLCVVAEIVDPELCIAEFLELPADPISAALALKGMGLDPLDTFKAIENAACNIGVLANINPDGTFVSMN